MKRTGTMETPGAVMPRYVKGLGAKSRTMFQSHMLMAKWPEIVGRAIAANVHPVRMDYHVLYLSCSDSSWANEIRLMQTDILEKIADVAGEGFVKELHFLRPGLRGFVAKGESDDAPEEDEPDLSGIELSAEESAHAAEIASCIDDEKLRKKAERLAGDAMKLRHHRCEEGWLPCALCGTLAEPVSGRAAVRENKSTIERECNGIEIDDAVLCPTCARRMKEKTAYRVRQFLMDIPWATYAQVKAEIDCPSSLVNDERASLVQRYTRRVKWGDFTSMDAKMLVMLYRCVPPESLTDDMMRRTLYKLRWSLIHDEAFKPIKRYDVIRLKGDK
ncbi:MAG: DUF721 domain-containing protein [Veillonellaceae bacterium]|nr:DUF721 domain-containing protein [Veillonellaceae bacterium]MDD6923812.1 DUF721 domain-containing protein [Veillonellaceae bacterium]